jgi:hypothetical protein
MLRIDDRRKVSRIVHSVFFAQVTHSTLVVASSACQHVLFVVMHTSERVENENHGVRSRMSCASMTGRDTSRRWQLPGNNSSAAVEYRRLYARRVEWVREY